jgi:hypothetical protein
MAIKALSASKVVSGCYGSRGGINIMRTRHNIDVMRNIAYLVPFEEGKPLKMLIFRFENGKYFYVANPQNYVRRFLGGIVKRARDACRRLVCWCCYYSESLRPELAWVASVSPVYASEPFSGSSETIVLYEIFSVRLPFLEGLIMFPVLLIYTFTLI